MNDKRIDQLMARLEREHNDELNFIEQFDLCYFETTYLEELYKKWKVKYKKLMRQYHQLLLLAALSPIWLIVGLFGAYFKMMILAFFAYLFPASIAIFILGMFQIYQKSGGIKHCNTVGKSVHQELTRRRDGFSLKPSS